MSRVSLSRERKSHFSLAQRPPEKGKGPPCARAKLFDYWFVRRYRGEQLQHARQSRDAETCEQYARELSQRHPVVLTMASYRPDQHRRSPLLVFGACATCPRKGKLVLAPGRVDEVCVDPTCYAAQARRTSEERARRLEERHRARSMALAALLRTEYVQHEHLQLLMWAMLRALGPFVGRWRAGAARRRLTAGVGYVEPWGPMSGGFPHSSVSVWAISPPLGSSLLCWMSQGPWPKQSSTAAHPVYLAARSHTTPAWGEALPVGRAVSLFCALQGHDKHKEEKPMAKTQLETITTRDNLRPVRLAESYAAGEAELSIIHAFNHVDAERKQRFHQDALRFLRSVGAYLRRLGGFEQMACHSNKGGIAVAGEIYATYLHPGRKVRLEVAVESDWSGESSDRQDRVVILAQRCDLAADQVPGETQGQPVQDQGLPLKRKSGRGKGVSIAAYRHAQPTAGGPRCCLNPDFDSEETARCLLLVLESPRGTSFWEWLPDGTLMQDGQRYAYQQVRREARERARLAKGRWQPIVGEQAEAAGGVMLRDDYLAGMSCRLLFEGSPPANGGTNARKLEQPRFSRSGEQTFLQRDFERDAQSFLRALGRCLIPYGYGQMRLVEREDAMMAFADYRRDPAGEVLRVKIGQVLNTDVVQRHDHLVICAFVAPDGTVEGSEDEQVIELGVPIRLTAGAYAAKLTAIMGEPLPVKVDPVDSASSTPAQPVGKRRGMKRAAPSTGDGDLVHTPLF